MPPAASEPEPIWTLEEGEGAVVAVALHDGHAVRDEVATHLALAPQERLREEDPFTGTWTQIAGTRLVATRSRFEVDLNRPRAGAVYRTPADAWGLNVWKDPPPPADLVERSLAEHDAFYAEAERVLRRVQERHGRFVVYDLHAYNHRRHGPGGPPGHPGEHPEVDVGTGTMDRARWAPVIERFKADLGAFDFHGRRLDVRENVKFTGGHFARWVHATFPASACVLFVEVKKIFMDEWTGTPDRARIASIRRGLASTVPGVEEELRRTGAGASSP